jgi:branched-chain amino acid transport system permease protein
VHHRAASGRAGVTASTKRTLWCAGGILASFVLSNLLNRGLQGRWMPNAAVLQAIVSGSLVSMFSVGLVLIYRAARIVNFAQGALGVASAVLFFSLVAIEGWNFWLALLACLALAVVTGFAVELMIVRRLAKAPRLALTVVTIAVAQILIAVSGFVPVLFLGEGDELELGGITTPFSSFRFSWNPLVFSGNDIATIVIVLIVFAGLAAFLRFSSAGIAVRGAAENDDRAALLGVNVANLSSLIWTIAAGISGLAAILNTMISTNPVGAAVANAAGGGIVLRGLAAAVVARMEHLPTAVAASIAIAIYEQGMLWGFDNTSISDVGLLVLIVVILLAQRAKFTRSDESLSGTWAANVEVRGIPHELKDVPSVQTGVRRARFLLFGALAVYPWVMSPSQTSLGSVYLIYGVIVISLVVLTGWGGQLSLGQFAFVGIGAVIGGALTAKVGLPFPLAVLLASLAGAGVAILVGLPAMRIKGLFLAVTTLAFAVAVGSVFLSPRFFGWLIPQEVPRPKVLFVDFADERAYYYLCVAGLLFAVWVAQGIRNSRAGRVLIAMRENERAAQAFTINRVRTRPATFAIAGFLAAFAGSLLAHQQGAVRADNYSPSMSILIFLLAVIGGLGSLGGSLTGVAYYACVSLFIANPFAQGFAIGVGVLVILMFFPGGLGGLLFQLRDSWLRRVAMRQRIYVPSLIGDHRVLDAARNLVALAPKFSGPADDDTARKKYRLDSTIGVRGGSQAAPGWRWG